MLLYLFIRAGKSVKSRTLTSVVAIGVPLFVPLHFGLLKLLFVEYHVTARQQH